MKQHRTTLLSLLLITLSACSQHDVFDSELVEPPKVGQITRSAHMLAALPPPKTPIAVSVYEFQDQTGQLKANTQYAEYSKAVTQGGVAILNKAFLTAGNGSWFTVVERGGLRNLLQERQIISMMRDQYTLDNGDKLGRLPPLLYAGMLIEGGIIGYDSNIITGGAGMKYLGIGGDVKHQRDIVTIDLRAVNIANGQVVLSVTSEKTIYSTGVSGNVFKYVTFDKLLEAETGFTMNEPPQLAVRQAIDTAVYSLVMEGARRNIWQFADEEKGRALVAEYLKRIEEENAGGLPETAPAPVKSVPNVQVPASSQPTGNGSAVQGANAEKKSIIEKTSDMLSFGDEKNKKDAPHQDTPYPIAPVPPSTPR